MLVAVPRGQSPRLRRSGSEAVTTHDLYDLRLRVLDSIVSEPVSGAECRAPVPARRRLVSRRRSRSGLPGCRRSSPRSGHGCALERPGAGASLNPSLSRTNTRAPTKRLPCEAPSFSDSRSQVVRFESDRKPDPRSLCSAKVRAAGTQHDGHPAFASSRCLLPLQPYVNKTAQPRVDSVAKSLHLREF